MSMRCKYCGQGFIEPGNACYTCWRDAKEDAIANRAIEIRGDDNELLEIMSGCAEAIPPEVDKAMAEFFHRCDDLISWPADTPPWLRKVAATIGTYLRAASTRQATEEIENSNEFAEVEA